MKARTPVHIDRLPVETHGRLDQVNDATLRQRLREAEEHLTYWSGKRARAERQAARDVASGLVNLWTYQVAEIKRHLLIRSLRVSA